MTINLDENELNTIQLLASERGMSAVDIKSLTRELESTYNANFYEDVSDILDDWLNEDY